MPIATTSGGRGFPASCVTSHCSACSMAASATTASERARHVPVHAWRHQVRRHALAYFCGVACRRADTDKCSFIWRVRPSVWPPGPRARTLERVPPRGARVRGRPITSVPTAGRGKRQASRIPSCEEHQRGGCLSIGRDGLEPVTTEILARVAAETSEQRARKSWRGSPLRPQTTSPRHETALRRSTPAGHR